MSLRWLPFLVVPLLVLAHGAALAQATTPEPRIGTAVDGLLAAKTDAEVRAILRESLIRDAQAEASLQGAVEPVAERLRQRLALMGASIAKTLGEVRDAVGSLARHRPAIDARLAMATAGGPGMAVAALLVAGTGIAAAVLVVALTAKARRWLEQAGVTTYWDRLVRTLALAITGYAPIFVFELATVTAARTAQGPLGPLVDYVWIWHAGIASAWTLILLARCSLAPWAPAIRLAPIPDADAVDLFRLVRRATLLGAVGWLAAGLLPTFGLGYPPAIALVALSGTAVLVVLLVATWQNRARLRGAIAAQVPDNAGAAGRIAVHAWPWAIAGYILFAWGYWLAHWLEMGQARLAGPAGTLLLLLLAPVADRLGAEAVAAVMGGSALGQRLGRVLHGLWRAVLGVGAVYLIARLWGLDLYPLVMGPGAPVAARIGWRIGLTLLAARLVWRLVEALLPPPETTVAHDAEEAADDLAEASRTQTLVPLLRTTLLLVVTGVAVISLLSALGVDIGPLLASAGIVGIAIGFGAQTLVRDIFSGAFFLVDDAFRVGEYVELDAGTRGTVEAISLRSLRLRHHRGPVVTIPFGELHSVTNHSRDWVIVKLAFRLEPETDPELVRRLVKNLGQELLQDPIHGPKFLEPLKSQGVLTIDDDSAIVIRVKFKSRPGAQFVLRREVYHRVRTAFAAKGIRFARRKVEVVTTGGAPAAPAHAAVVERLEA
jgi:small-conductance mechanosensitive channel